MVGFRTVFAALALVVSCGPVIAAGDSYAGLFDVGSRRMQLQTPEFASVREACLAVDADTTWLNIPVIKGLDATEGYGTDRSANEFSWAVMVLGGRSLAGDAAATEMLRELLLVWSDADAFGKTQKEHDAYYSLKRILLPLSVNFSIIRADLTPEEEQQLINWIDPLVRQVDHLFNGDVDLNNHRDLADSVLTVWGAMVGDQVLLAKGHDRYLSTLGQARPDGSVPLETRRGARALWYTRQLLSSLTVIAEAARGQGDDLYGAKIGHATLWTLMSFWLNGINNPVLINAYAGQNYTPGPTIDFRAQDYGFMDVRSNGRHYLAFLEAISSHPSSSLGQRRTIAAFQRLALDERPLIDEFAGGNATCFWGQPR